MTTLYHSYSYTPYENAPIEPYNYPEGQAITRELIEEKLLSDSSQFLAILEDSYKAGKLSLDQAPSQGYLCLLKDKQAKNGLGYLATMTQQELEAYLSPYKAEIIKEGIDREVKERIRS